MNIGELASFEGEGAGEVGEKEHNKPKTASRCHMELVWFGSFGSSHEGHEQRSSFGTQLLPFVRHPAQSA